MRRAAALKERLASAEVIGVREAAEAMALLDAGSVDAFASNQLKLVGAALLSNDAKALAQVYAGGNCSRSSAARSARSARRPGSCCRCTR